MNFGWLDLPINFWISLGPQLQTILAAILGLIAGVWCNHVIPTWAWYARPSSVWTNPKKWPLDSESRKKIDALPDRSWIDRIPILGWIAMRRESPVYGTWFWIRPILIEVSLMVVFPIMHGLWIGGHLLPSGTVPAVVAACVPWMTLVFFAHALLLALMVASTFIDFDERTIPDKITIPGTILGLALLTITPFSLQPGEHAQGLMPVTLQHPFDVPTLNPLNWWMSGSGLAVGLSIWSMWCFALADRRVITRRGLAKAVEYFFAGLVRYPTWKLLAGIWAVGIVAIVGVYQIGGVHWLGLQSGLLGMAVGGGIVWSIRLVAGMAMGVEAMGFGDVTLMAMIGAFVGWQASVTAFFLAPVAAIAIVLVVFMITRDPATPFGPYLCAGTVLTIGFWDQIYNAQFRMNLLLLGDFLLYLAIATLGLLGAMLFVWRLIKQSLFAR